MNEKEFKERFKKCMSLLFPAAMATLQAEPSPRFAEAGSKAKECGRD